MLTDLVTMYLDTNDSPVQRNVEVCPCVLLRYSPFTGVDPLALTEANLLVSNLACWPVWPRISRVTTHWAVTTFDLFAFGMMVHL
jgi:ABC-type lipopolysaccharide export system ATPase subunit